MVFFRHLLFGGFGTPFMPIASVGLKYLIDILKTNVLLHEMCEKIISVDSC